MPPTSQTGITRSQALLGSGLMFTAVGCSLIAVAPWVGVGLLAVAIITLLASVVGAPPCGQGEKG